MTGLLLPDGRPLFVRPATPEDADGLAALYETLSDEDLHFRFFSIHHPPHEFYERLAGAEDHHGFTLVAVVEDPEEHIVGEADYFLLENGNGELAVTVAPDWRGWLGAYLLDALLGAAARRGVPNLEAQILVENRRMLALIRRRRYAMVDGTDFSTVRVVVGTTSAVPTWPDPHDRVRVLAEVPGGRWRREEAARDAGMHVLVCPGPRPGPDPGCPLLDNKPCPLAEGADIIFCALGREREHGEEVHAAHAVFHPGATLVSEGAPAAPGEVTIECRLDDAAVIELLQDVASGGAQRGRTAAR